MPDWNSVMREITVAQAEAQVTNQSGFDLVRRRYLKRLFRHTGRNVISYYSGFLSKPGLQGVEITDEDKNGFMLCIHKLDRTRGLDLILHTPGGHIAATESLVHYLKQMFGNDIRAVVPQIAMSAGTMIACSCKSILMSKHANVGPIDPQLNGLPAVGILLEIQRAFEEIKADPARAMLWQPIFARLPPSFVQQCEWAVTRSNEFLREVLGENMFGAMPPAKQEKAIEKVSNKLIATIAHRGHSQHFHHEACRQMGLKIEMMEDDPKLQDVILTIHHCYMHTMANSNAFKVIENHEGKAMIKNVNILPNLPQPQFFVPQVSVPPVPRPPEPNPPASDTAEGAAAAATLPLTLRS